MTVYCEFWKDKKERFEFDFATRQSPLRNKSRPSINMESINMAIIEQSLLSSYLFEVHIFKTSAVDVWWWTPWFTKKRKQMVRRYIWKHAHTQMQCFNPILLENIRTVGYVIQWIRRPRSVIIWMISKRKNDLAKFLLAYTDWNALSAA